MGLQRAQQAGELDQGWLDLEQIATVEVTSEDPSFPIESAFNSRDGTGWRAAEKGEQQIRIIFDEPVSLRRIHLRFHEAQMSECRSLSFDGRLPGAANPAKSCDNNGISALPAQPRKLKIIWWTWRPSQSWNSRFSPT